MCVCVCVFYGLVFKTILTFFNSFTYLIIFLPTLLCKQSHSVAYKFNVTFHFDGGGGGERGYRVVHHYSLVSKHVLISQLGKTRYTVELIIIRSSTEEADLHPQAVFAKNK